MALSHPTTFQDAVRGRILRILSSHVSIQEELEPVLLSDQAKFLRATLVRSFAQDFVSKWGPDAVVDVAAAAELVHAASLVHDDIIDEAPLRRGVPTLHQNNPTAWAVLAGDFLLSQAVRSVEPHGSPMLSALTRVVEDLALAAMEEWKLRKSTPASEKRLREIAAGKTGSLFGFCLQAGALLEGKHELAQKRYRAGVILGVAYQGVDDLLDLIGIPGKPRAADLRESNPNRVLALATDQALVPPQFAQALDSHNWEGAAEILLNTPAAEAVWRAVRSDLDSVEELLGTEAQIPELQFFLQLLRKDPRHEREHVGNFTQKHHHL